ncbi:MAG: zf-HC2 domain-containing protein [Planctomycetota bacterium]
MNCEQISLELVGLLYDELDAVDARTIRAHLDECSDCRREWIELQESMSALDADAAQDGSQCRVDVAKIVDRLPPQRATGRWWKSVAAIALACGAALLLAATAGVRLTLDENQVTVGWGASESDDENPGEDSQAALAAQQFLDCVARLQELESRLDKAVTNVELNQVRQGTVLASLEDELDEVRRRGEVRWRTTNLVRKENQAQIAAMRNAVDSVFVRLERSRRQPVTRSQRGG